LEKIGLNQDIINKERTVKFPTGFINTTTAFEKQKKDNNNLPTKEKEYSFIDFTPQVRRTALNKIKFYCFNNLKKHFRHLTSTSEFIENENYLKNIKIKLKGLKETVENPSPKTQLYAAIIVLNQIAKEIGENDIEYIGDKVFKQKTIKKTFGEKKIMNINIVEGSDREYGESQSNSMNQNLKIDLSEENWYAFNDNYGTDVEKYFVKYIKTVYDEWLKKEYEEVYLLRNQKYFKIYNFKDGRAFEPDFVLFLKEKKTQKEMSYQLFIEPKGEHLLETDKWKEDFLKEIELIKLYENEEFKLIGLPFYIQQKANFKKEFKILRKNNNLTNKK